jgi:hypothetical protein
LGLPVFLPVTPKILLGRDGGRRKRGNMHEVLKDFALDMLRQLFGWSHPRGGKLVLTRNALHKMHEFQIEMDTLADAFKHGEAIQKGDKMQITRNYANYSVGLWYKTIYTPFHKNLKSEKRFLIITCWKGGV